MQDNVRRARPTATWPKPPDLCVMCGEGTAYATRIRDPLHQVCRIARLRSHSARHAFARTSWMRASDRKRSPCWQDTSAWKPRAGTAAHRAHRLRICHKRLQPSAPPHTAPSGRNRNGGLESKTVHVDRGLRLVPLAPPGTTVHDSGPHFSPAEGIRDPGAVAFASRERPLGEPLPTPGIAPESGNLSTYCLGDCVSIGCAPFETPRPSECPIVPRGLGLSDL